METAAYHYSCIECAIAYLHAQFPRQVSLEELAAQARLSPFHFQRVFTEWAGVSPKKYLQHLTLRYAKQQLAQAGNLAEAGQNTGLSGTGRLHDLFVRLQGITPGEYQQLGKTLTIRYGLHTSPFGQVLAAITDRGLCKLAFTDSPEWHVQELRDEWPLATFQEDQQATEAIVNQIFGTATDPKPIPLLLKGTPFQLQVWEALLRIPESRLATYGQVAAAIHKPAAVRAVGTAIGQNPVAYLIPCHRVIRKSGGWGDYRWGLPRKLALIGWEACRQDQSAAAGQVSLFPDEE